MDDIGWLKQDKQPLFPDVLWSRPQNRRTAGKLLIVGGHSQSFSAVSGVYAAAAQAGAGHIRLVLPDSLQKMLKGTLAEAEFAPSTPIGSFGQAALGPILDAAAWADGALLAGDFGRNSETAVMLEKLVGKYAGQLVITGDSLDYFTYNPQAILQRPDTLICGNLGQLQKLAQPQILIRQGSELLQTTKALKDWSRQIAAGLVTIKFPWIIVGLADHQSLTKTPANAPTGALAAYSGVWMIQHRGQAFEALTTAAYCFVTS